MTKRDSTTLASHDVDMALVDESNLKKVKIDQAIAKDVYTIESDFLKNSKFEITYMEARARAETARYLLEYVGAKYTSKAPVNWPGDKSKTPFGVLPVLVHSKPNGDKLEVPESHTLVRYLARLFGLMGDTAEEEAIVDAFYTSAAENIFDTLMTELWLKPNQKDEETIKTCFEKLVPFLDGLEKFLVRNGTNGYVLHEKATYADFCIFDWLDFFFSDYPDNIKPLVSETVRPGLFKLYSRLNSHPRIRAYIDGGRWKFRPSGPLVSMYSAGVNVSDYEKSLEFYTEKVGLTCVLNVRPEGFGERERYIELATEADGSGTKFTLYSPGTTLEKFKETYKIPDTPAAAFNVDNVKEAHDRLVKNGVTFSMGPTNLPWGSMALFSDPDGNSLSITNAKPFDE
ncbi:hypothetical protein BGZ94_005607 [Podila epigama]|nr:hypothetical protein BGZ94_005607 [Podila epigama]